MRCIERTSVVSGHKRDGDPDAPDDITRTRRYIEDFTAIASEADNHLDLYNAMLTRYPDRLNRGVLWNSAKTVLS